MDKTCWLGVGLRHRRGRRRWHWRPGRRWGRSWRVFRSSVRVLARARRRWGSAPSGRFHLIGVVLEHGGVDWGLALLGGFHLIGCNTSSVTSNMVESVLLAPFGVVFVPPDTCHLPCGTIGARSNAKPAPVTCRLACGIVRREGVLRCRAGRLQARAASASGGRAPGARQAWAARAPRAYGRVSGTLRGRRGCTLTFEDAR